MTPFRTSLLLGATAGLLTSGALGQSFGSAVTTSTPQRPDQTAQADFNGDGNGDLAVSLDTPDRVSIFLGNGAGGFALLTDVFTGGGTGPAALIARDFDGNGDIDIAVSLHNVNAVALITNTGSGFSLGAATGVGGVEPRRMAVGDVDADGLLDLVTSNRESDNVSTMLGTGAGFTLAGTTPAGVEPRGVALADFDGDCQLDLVVGSHDDRTVRVLRGNGAGGFAPDATISVAPARPDDVVTADFDGDHDMDFAVARSDDAPPINDVSVFLNSGGAFGFPLNAPTGGVNPDSLVATDFDGDGDVDVAVSNQDSNTVSIMGNSGTGLLALVQTIAVGAGPSHVSCGDLDGNGSADIVAANEDSDSVSRMLNLDAGGAKPFCQTSPNSVGAGASIGYGGRIDLAAGSFTLVATCAPAGQPGIFYYGPNEARIPFGNGLRCVSGGVVRLLPPVATDGSGTATRGAGTADGLTAGSTHKFQFWYRDPAAGGAAFNLSDGLSVTFRP